MKKSTNPRSPLLRFLDGLDALILRGWRVFVSLKFGIFLLILIGLVAIWGTMGFASNAALGDNSIPMARTLVFEHPLFVGLLLLFAVNLIISTWHVTKMSFGIWWKRDFRRAAGYYESGSAPRATVAVPGGVDEVEGVLRRRFTRAHRDGNVFFAHRGIISRLGPTIVHIGILTVIGSAVAKAILLWSGSIITEGRFIAAEGEEFAIIHQPIAREQQITDRNRRETPIDVWIKVLDFDEIMHPNSNVPAHFRSLVEVRDPRTQRVTVAQLDMNHKLKIHTSRYGTLQFHQAGYQAVEDGEFQRINFDVRDAETGERIAVTDTHPGNRVRVGETDLFFEVDGRQPGDRWRLYRAAAPYEVHAEGLLTGGKELRFSYEPAEFYPDFRINPETGQPHNASNDPRNPALKTAIFLDDRRVEDTWLFYDRQLADMMPELHPRYRLRLADIRIPEGRDLAEIDWSRPGMAVFDVMLTDRNSGAERIESLVLGERSESLVYTAEIDHEGVQLGTENNFEVRILGPTQRYITVLSVVNEPTVPYTMLGVTIILIGALMTFSVRYRAFHGLWDEETQTLRMALVPRWGQSPVQEEFDALVAELSHGAGAIRVVTPSPADEPPPAIVSEEEPEREMAGVSG